MTPQEQHNLRPAMSPAYLAYLESLPTVEELATMVVTAARMYEQACADAARLAATYVKLMDSLPVTAVPARIPVLPAVDSCDELLERLEAKVDRLLPHVDPWDLN